MSYKEHEGWKPHCTDGHQSTLTLRPCRTALFEFDDVPADLPAGLNLNCIDGSQCPLPGALNQIAKTCWSTLRCGLKLHHVANAAET
jgi:hypothetical protein